MSDMIIKVSNLSKRYRIGAREQGYSTIREAIVNGITAPARNLAKLRSLTRFENGNGNEQDVIWALKDVSFEVKRGEVLGIIGRNGAGKSTLLKILSRITEPSSGQVDIYGRVSSLLEVGTGFHPELTGRENIFLDGAILGMKKREIEGRFDDIVGFSEIGKFLDTPVKRYSSGMYVRLAFAVAAHLDPEILLIDEVLAVGDMAFQQKCLGKMEEVAKGGRTVLFVSHNMGAVAKLCSKAILLDNGNAVYMGNVSNTIDYYAKSVPRSGEADISFTVDPRKEAQIHRIKLTNHRGEASLRIDRDFPFRLVVEYRVKDEIADAHIGVNLDRYDGTRVCFSRDIDTNPHLLNRRKPGNYRSVLEFPGGILNSGTYLINVGIGRHGEKAFDYHDAFVFDVYEVGVFTHPLGAGKRPGVIAIPLKWETEEL